MNKTSRLLRCLAGLLVITCVVAAADIGSAAAATKPETIIEIANAPSSQGFWAIAYHGLTQAGKDLGINTIYRGTPGDITTPTAEYQLIEAAIAEHPSGLIIADPTPPALDPAIKQAVAAGIPVVLATEGLGLAKQLGALTYVGNNENAAGALMGTQLNASNCKSAVIFTTTPGTVPLFDGRTAGFVSTFKGTVVKEAVPVTVLNGSASAMTGNWGAALAKNPSVDCALSLGGTTTAEMLAARSSLGSRGTSMHWFAIDCISGVYQAVQAHTLVSCADQQQFLEGYLPVVFLNNYIRWGLLPGSDYVQTGPRLVDWANVKVFASSHATTVSG